MFKTKTVLAQMQSFIPGSKFEKYVSDVSAKAYPAVKHQINTSQKNRSESI